MRRKHKSSKSIILPVLFTYFFMILFGVIVSSLEASHLEKQLFSGRKVTTNNPILDELLQDNSSKKHMVTSAALSSVISSVIPCYGDNITVAMGEAREAGATDMDSRMDLRYNKMGAEIGNRMGTTVFVMFVLFLLTIYMSTTKWWNKYITR